jgi:ATP-dependent Clp protease ATP-binding subunit ClpA
MAERFDKFTERTQRALACGQEEAQRFGHTYFGTEHLLLGLVREKDGIAARVLSEFGIQTPKVRAAIEAIVGRGQPAPGHEIGLTPRAKQAIERSVDEARQRDHRSIDTAHLLLGLLRVEGSMASEVLLALNADIEAVRARVADILSGYDAAQRRAGRGGATPTEPIDLDHFTERARRVLTLAQEEAQRFNHNYIGTEHILLGLVREGDGIAARVLFNLGVQLPDVRAAVEFIIGRGQTAIMGPIGLTPRTKTVLALAVDEASRLHHRHIGTEHLLLGLVREGEGIAAGVLESMGVSLERVRAEVVRAASGAPDAATPAAAPTPAVPPPPRPSRDAVPPHQRYLGTLLQVIPIVQSQARAVAILVAIALERYDNGFAIAWRVRLTNGQGESPIWECTAEDDRGTRYRSTIHGGSADGGTPDDHAWRFAHLFGPALAADTRSLTVTCTPVSTPLAANIGPDHWRFTVAIPPLPEA